MAAKRRPRKPLRSELSDGIKKKRLQKSAKTVAAILNLPAKVVEDAEVETEEESETNFTDLIEEDELSERLSPGAESVEDSSEDDESEISSEEDEIRAIAKDLKISHWWTKKVETLELEIEKIKQDTEQSHEE